MALDYLLWTSPDPATSVTPDAKAYLTIATQAAEYVATHPSLSLSNAYSSHFPELAHTPSVCDVVFANTTRYWINTYLLSSRSNVNTYIYPAKIPVHMMSAANISPASGILVFCYEVFLKHIRDVRLQVLYAPLQEQICRREGPCVASSSPRDVLVHVGHEVTVVCELLRERQPYHLRYGHTLCVMLCFVWMG